MATALVIIDAQTSLIAEGAWNAEAVLSRIQAMIGRARQEGASVIFVVDRRVSPDGSIHPSLDVQASDPIISKGYCDSFFDTSLEKELMSRGIQRIVVVGLQSDYCIDTTCRRAVSLGFDVQLVSDTRTTFDHEFLEASKIVAHHNRILRDFPAGSKRVRVVPSSDVVFANVDEPT